MLGIFLPFLLLISFLAIVFFASQFHWLPPWSEHWCRFRLFRRWCCYADIFFAGLLYYFFFFRCFRRLHRGFGELRRAPSSSSSSSAPLRQPPAAFDFLRFRCAGCRRCQPLHFRCGFHFFDCWFSPDTASLKVAATAQLRLRHWYFADFRRYCRFAARLADAFFFRRWLTPLIFFD